MSLLINGMDMPKNCFECPCHSYEKTGIGCIVFCQALPNKMSVNLMFRGDKTRHKNCPLSEIPTPHGRLIDADKLAIAVLDAMNQGTDISVIGLIDRAPTIIEAEE